MVQSLLNHKIEAATDPTRSSLKKRAGNGEFDLGKGMEAEAPPPPPDSGEVLDVGTICSEIKALFEQRRNENKVFAGSRSESDGVLQDFYLNFEGMDNEFKMFVDMHDLDIEDLEARWEEVKKEIGVLEEENLKKEDEIKALREVGYQESMQTESSLRIFWAQLEDVEAQDLQKSHSNTSQSQECSKAENIAYKLENMAIDNLIEKNTSILNALQDLHYVHQSETAVEFVEDTVSDIKVLGYEGNWIKLLCTTYVPTSESRLYQQVLECASEPHVVEHELLIEFADETFELKNVKIFPDDVYIGEVVESAKSLRLSFLPLSLLTSKSPMEWLVRKIQYRIILCALRHSVVKASNKSRHSFEYIDRDETITARLVEGVHALIKISGSWPASTLTLNLVSLMNSEFRLKEVPVSTLCRVQELANSLPDETRRHLVNFVDAIGEILIRQSLIRD